MSKKFSLMVFLSIVSFIVTILPVMTTFGSLWGFFDILKGGFIGIYFMSLGVIIYFDSKSIVKAIIYQTIPLLILGVVIYLSINILKISIKTSSNLEFSFFLILSTITYLSPMICYLIYFRYSHQNN